MKKIIFSALLAIIVVAAIALAEFFPTVIVTGTDGKWTDTRAYSSIATAITAIGVNERVLIVVGEEAVTTLTIPINVQLKFLSNGSLTVATQLTLQTYDIDAGDHEIFSGAGDIDFASGSVVRSAWFDHLDRALDLTSDDTLTMVISRAETLTADAAVGTNVTLRWESPFIITDGGFTLSGLKKIEAGTYQIFSGSNDFDFLAGSVVHSSWFQDLNDVIEFTTDENVNLTILVDQPETIDFNVTVDTYQSLDIKKGCLISVDAGQTLTIYSPGNIVATPTQQAFAGAGSVAFSSGGGTVYPDWFGATRYDVTDDSAAIQTALDAGSGTTVYFSDGVYTSTAILTVSNDNLTITGPGTLDFPTNGLAENARLELEASGTTIRDLKITSNGASRTGIYGLITVDGVAAARYNTTIDGCEITGSDGVGIHMMNSHNFTISNNYIHDTWADGIHIQRGSSNFTISNNTVIDVGDDAIGLVSHDYDTFGTVQDGTVTGNVLGNGKATTSGGGLGLVGVISMTATGNTIRDTQLSGMRIAAFYSIAEGSSMVGRLTVIGNTIQNTGLNPGLGGTTEGISIFNGRHIIVSKNVISNTYGAGISLGNSNVDIIIDGNELSDVGTNENPGIWVSGLEQAGDFLALWTDPLLDDGTLLAYVFVHDIRITNNVIRTTGSSGIQATGLITRSIDGLWVVGNKIIRANEDAVATSYGLWVRYADDITILDNEIRDPLNALTLTWNISDYTNDHIVRNLPPWNDLTYGAATYVGLSRHFSSDAAPLVGTYLLGDIVWNWNPLSGILMWVCTVAGTPGTWITIPWLELDPATSINIPHIPVYANNAAAIAGGLSAGNLYRSGADPDVVSMVH